MVNFSLEGKIALVGMCGENQDYGDMDTIANKDLR